MVGVKGRSGGARAGAGHPKGVPGARTEGAHMLNILVNLAKNAESGHQKLRLLCEGLREVLRPTGRRCRCGALR